MSPNGCEAGDYDCGQSLGQQSCSFWVDPDRVHVLGEARVHFSTYRYRNGNDIDADVLPLPAGRPTSYPPELLQLLVIPLVKIRLRTNGHVEENKLRPCWRNGGQPSSWGVSIAKAAPSKDKKIGIR